MTRTTRLGSLKPFGVEQVARACLYSLPDGAAKDAAGDFLSGRGLGAADRSALAAALAAGEPGTGRCDTAATRFAIISNDRDSASVELDGCRRVSLFMSEGNRQVTIRLRASDELVRLLTSGAVTP